MDEPSLTITTADLAGAVPLRSSRPVGGAHLMTDPNLLPTSRAVPRTNRLAITALIVALAGIPLFGLITGIVAMILGCVALGGIHKAHQRGTWLALAGILLGIVDVVGWILFLSIGLTQPGPALSLDDFEPDMAAMENLDPHISRAMKANVLIETKSAWGALGGTGVASGVVVRVQHGEALIVTNRHVVDPNLNADQLVPASDHDQPSLLMVKLFGMPAQPGRVRWIAPDGIDLALVSTTASGESVQAALWQPRQQEDRQLSVGMDVFAIGNPHGLGWTHTQGVVSQLRMQQRGNRRLHIIQTSAAINPGNSGGGLYDKDGRLIGINTWTNDKRVSEGLGFAIDIESLLSLDPPGLTAPSENEPAPGDE